MSDAASAPRRRWIPALVIAAVAIALVPSAVWLTDRQPQTSDACAFADTIKVVPQVSGHIVELPVADNQRLRKGELLFRIDPRPYRLALEQARAQLEGLEAQISLTKRSVAAQKFGPESAMVAVAVVRANAT
ncbi:MAG TPA: biotin/lipoyl-binding protein [Nevskiaceae bacterium]